jgi:hypothetical protein
MFYESQYTVTQVLISHKIRALKLLESGPGYSVSLTFLRRHINCWFQILVFHISAQRLLLLLTSSCQIFPYRLGSVAYSREKRLVASSHLSVHPSIRPRASTWLSLDGFSRNLTLETFTKNLSRKSDFEQNRKKNIEHFT